MMLDLQAISDELTKGFILREYQERTPMLRIQDIEKEAGILYRHDPIFHNRVTSVVAGVMQIIEKHNQ